MATVALTAPAHALQYERDIKPLLKQHCYACHGALKQKGGLRLDTVAAMRSGGDEGESILEPGHALLIDRVTTTKTKEQMPPEGQGPRMAADEVSKLQAWIAAGAPGPAQEQPEPDPRRHWAYQSPKSAGASLDVLLTRRLEARHLHAQREIAPELWLRRIYLDLIGLPPSIKEIEAFRQNSSEEARARVVDRLLASPQYGERWGRHFMDIWRYCDWYGLGEALRNSQKHLWHWRDWIVESLNEDKGYDRMILQMLAADELAPEDRANLRATGFLARSYYLFNRTTWLDDTIEHTCRAFLGITMQCTKCHDHKYDPIEQVDYYRMRAIFEPMHVRLDPWPGETDLEKNGLARVFDLHLDRPTWRHIRGDEKNQDKSRPMLPGVPAVLEFAPYETHALRLPADAAHPVLLSYVLQDQLKAVEKLEQTAAAKHAEAALHADQLREAMVRAVVAADRAGTDKALAHQAAQAEADWKLAQAGVDLSEVEQSPVPAGEKERVARDKKLKTCQAALEKAKKNLEKVGDTYTALRVSLKAQEGPDDSNAAAVQSYPDTSTGRRLALAQWMVDRRNPLTARVLVNHVWLRHFGQSLVPDVSDFGLRCPAPLHQDVLDALAVDFMNHGWSLKHLHRVMVLSDLYRRSSSNAGADAATLAADPDNAYYWRMNPRRMESQVLRDSLLSLAGKLDTTMGGPSLEPAAADRSHRRALYFVQTAHEEQKFLAAFDNSNVLECYRRNESIVPQQALALSNGALSHECAQALAAQLSAAVSSGGDDAFIRQAFLAVLSRFPTERELQASQAGLQALHQNRELFVQALFNHNDFVTLR